MTRDALIAEVAARVRMLNKVLENPKLTDEAKARYEGALSALLGVQEQVEALDMVYSE